jgi:ABC-type multidrug transport system ATPase subunit
MQISLSNTGKRYNREWIFRHFSYDFVSGKKYAITGSNGSGKSTLLQIIGGAVSHNEGDIKYQLQNQPIASENIYESVSLAAPYLELIEEMTTKEFLVFHAQFKKLQLPISEAIQIVGLEKATNKQIRNFSSGMKQRLKLAQAFFSEAPVLLLDEPTTNLDLDGVHLYLQLIANYTKDKMVIISSNDKQEYDFCDETIVISDFK